MSLKRKFDLSSDEVKRKCIDEIITRLDEVSGEKVGIITAEDILSIVTENIGPDIYNKAIEDSKELLKGRFADIEVELDLLKSDT